MEIESVLVIQVDVTLMLVIMDDHRIDSKSNMWIHHSGDFSEGDPNCLIFVCFVNKNPSRAYFAA